MTEDKYIAIGKITGVHGLHGNLKVHSWSDSPDIWENDSPILIRSADGVEKSYTIDSARPYKKGVLMKLEEVADINAAERLIGSELLVLRKELPELDDDEYYWFEIIGMEVYTTDSEYLGRIDSIFPTGSNDVYVVKKKGMETLVPALESVIISVDPDKNIMTVDLPEGL